MPANTFDARMLLTRCSLPELAKLGRPAVEKIRDLWMGRFINEMYWLPLIETLIGTDRITNPQGNAHFLTALQAINPVRVCHRPRGGREARAWVVRLISHIKTMCPDPRILGLVRHRLTEVENGKEVFFVSSDCVPPATQSQASVEAWRVNSWVLYRYVRIGRQPLTPDESKAIILGTLDEKDLAAQAYKALP